MQLGKLDYQAITKKCLTEWELSQIYKFDQSDTDKPIYSIDSPPPFTSGALHMGHVLSYAYFDFAARYKRMQGFNVFYPQGWDCQGFPTEVKVEKKFGKGLARDQFKQKCVEMSLENLKVMKNQMKTMGFSPDWDLEYKTIDPSYHKKVQYSLLKMYEKNLVYREKHPVLYCTNCSSAIAKAETEDIEFDSVFNKIEFSIQDSEQKLLIATTRPELLHACVAIFINPQHPRAKELEGKNAITPLFEKTVPIILEPEVQLDFGTGAMMVCSFGDKMDVSWIYRYKLPVIEAFTHYGKVINAGEGFDGLSVNAMRAKVIEKLSEGKKLIEQQKIKHSVKVHDRCNKPVEYLVTMQWFIKIKDSKDKIIAAARKMRWIPGFSIQYLIDWTEFIDYDWVISRQRIYGTPIPFYYCNNCSKIYPAEISSLPIDPALTKPKNEKCECGGEIIGETSTCDCWVDSSITPLATSNWPDNPKLTSRTYPATLRPQGLEIIRTWAFYTIVRCLALTEGKPPFEEVLINGSVLGKDGKKMSKSAGNYEDPDVLMAKYAPDALRQWAALSGAVAKDRPFSYKDVEYSQTFLNKLFNAAKFCQLILEDFHPDKVTAQSVNLRLTDQWLLSKTAQLVRQCTVAMNEYDYYTAINAIQTFAWHELCDNYLEEIKYRVYNNEKKGIESKQAAQFALYHSMNTIIKLLAPFAPFVTEEIYQALFGKLEGTKSIHLTKYPNLQEGYINQSAENIVGVFHQIMGEIRRFKAKSGLALNEPISLVELTASEEVIKSLPSIEEEIINAGHVTKITAQIGETQSISISI